MVVRQPWIRRQLLGGVVVRQARLPCSGTLFFFCLVKNNSDRQLLYLTSCSTDARSLGSSSSFTNQTDARTRPSTANPIIMNAQLTNQIHCKPELGSRFQAPDACGLGVAYPALSERPEFAPDVFGSMTERLPMTSVLPRPSILRSWNI